MSSGTVSRELEQSGVWMIKAAMARCRGLSLALLVGIVGIVGAPMPASAVEKAGVAAAVVSPVSVAGAPRPGTADMRPGDDVFTDDRIRTGDGARAQIMFLDQTALTIGPNSDIVIDRFVYDPDKGTGEIAAEMATGFLRYLSGGVGSAAPENVTIGTPAATIGIRGSAIIVASMPGDPDTWFCGVLGPGLVNNALARRGACAMENEQGETEIRAAGFGAFVTKGKAPGAPIPIPKDILSRVHDELRPATRVAAPAVGGVGNTGETSGQETAETSEEAAEQNDLLTDRFDELTNNVASNVINPLPSLPPLPDDDVIITPDPALTLPIFAQTLSNGTVQTSLHVTGDIPFSDRRFNVFFGNPNGPSNFTNGIPVATIGSGPAGSNGELATILNLGFDGVTRISVFNLSDSTPGGTSLANQSDLLVALLRNGVLQRGPGGSVIVDGDLIDSISPAPGGQGNTFVAYEIAPNGDITRLGTFTDFESPGAVQ